MWKEENFSLNFQYVLNCFIILKEGTNTCECKEKIK